MPKFYVLEKVEAHKQGRRSEYERLIDRVVAADEAEALHDAKIKFGPSKARRITVLREGR